MPEQQFAQFEGWAHVELMGHQSTTGYVRTQYFGSTALLEVTAPEIAPHQIQLTKSCYCETEEHRETLCAPGTLIEVSLDAAKCIVAASSIYRITPLTEAQAMAKLPVRRRRLPQALQLATTPAPSMHCKNCDEYGEVDQATGLCSDCGSEAEEDEDMEGTN